MNFGDLIFSFLTVSLKANQNVTGLALTIFGTGVGQFVGEIMRIRIVLPLRIPPKMQIDMSIVACCILRLFRTQNKRLMGICFR